jgi:hypothetical protein
VAHALRRGSGGRNHLGGRAGISKKVGAASAAAKAKAAKVEAKLGLFEKASAQRIEAITLLTLSKAPLIEGEVVKYSGGKSKASRGNRRHKGQRRFFMVYKERVVWWAHAADAKAGKKFKNTLGLEMAQMKELDGLGERRSN